MRINYCDLCGSPIKEVWVLQIYKENKTILKKDICDRCKDILDNIFKKRFDRLMDLAEEMRVTYNKPTKTPKHDKQKKDK